MGLNDPLWSVLSLSLPIRVVTGAVGFLLSYMRNYTDWNAERRLRVTWERRLVGVVIPFA
jgi:hypothetical protein